jgi:hypothetical protein
MSVETVIVLPVLLWVLFAVLVFWDGFRASASTVKAAYAVSDLASRQRSAMDQDDVDGMRSVLDALSRAGRPGNAGRDGPGSIRISVVRRRIVAQSTDGSGNTTHETEMALDWSHVSGSALAPVATVEPLLPLVPELAPGDQLMIVEASVPWSPPVLEVLPARAMRSVAITRHRFGRRFCWEEC